MIDPDYDPNDDLLVNVVIVGILTLLFALLLLSGIASLVIWLVIKIFGY